MRDDDNCRETERTYLLPLYQKENQMFATIHTRRRIKSAVIISYSKIFFETGLGGRIERKVRKRQNGCRPILNRFCSRIARENSSYHHETPATSGWLFGTRHRARNIPI